MKRNLLLTMFLLAATCALRAEELSWQSDYDKALEEAKAQHKPVFLDFSAPWCGPCRMMETTTFADPKVQDNLRGYILVKVDFDHSPALVGKYGIHAIPACILLDQFGEKISENVGYANAEMFNTWLDRHEDGAYRKTSISQEVADHMKALSQNLENNDAAARDKAMASLLEAYCINETADDGGDIAAKTAETELRGFTQRRPALAATHLKDSRLAVRILFAALLSEKQRADLQFDPWEKSEVRNAAADRIAKSLATP